MIPHKIGYKLIFTVALTAMIIISIYAYVNIRSQSEVLLAEVGRHVNQLSETIKSSTRYDMLSNSRQDIEKVIQTIGSQPGIREVRIMNKVGEIIYDSDSSSIGTMIDMKSRQCISCHATPTPVENFAISDRTRIFRQHPDSARVFAIISPIITDRSCWSAPCHAHSPDDNILGVLDITICLHTIDQKIESAKIKMLIFGLVAILMLSLVVWYFIRIWVDKPVNELLDATKNVASGNLNYTIGDLGKNEIGMLARSFNNMTKKLSEARMQLFQSDKMASLGRLAAGVAHEINNPLTGILTYSSFLQKRAKNDKELQEDLSVIVRETKRSREIVKGLLDFARQSVPKKNKANVNQIIDQAVSVIENQLTIKQIKLEKHFDNKLPDVTVDANQIQQVIINLVENAIHAIDQSGGKITISTGLIDLKPYGITQIKQATCPKGHSLIDQAHKIEGQPSIRLKAKTEKSDGFINLDPIYGRANHHINITLKNKTNIDFSCPICNILLIDKTKKCPKCDAPVYFFEIPGKGRFEGCTTKNCNWQYWEAVELEGKREFVEIIISDNGSGIPEENLEKIFDPFFTTKGQRGTGLGLAVIWGIIDNHEGTISVDSKIGKGTRFTVRIPLVKI